MSEEKKEKKPAENTKTEEKTGVDEKVKPSEKPAKPAECTVCGKSIKNLWYYREGKYYCGKGCWKKYKKSEKEAAEKAAKEKEAQEKASGKKSG